MYEVMMKGKGHTWLRCNCALKMIWSNCTVRNWNCQSRVEEKSVSLFFVLVYPCTNHQLENFLNLHPIVSPFTLPPPFSFYFNIIIHSSCPSSHLIPITIIWTAFPVWNMMIVARRLTLYSILRRHPRQPCTITAPGAHHLLLKKVSIRYHIDHFHLHH